VGASILSDRLRGRSYRSAKTSGARLEGVGGSATSVVVETQIRMAQETGQTVLFKGHFAAFTDPAALDISVLGRDISNMFALIVDRPQDVVCLLGRGHQYKIFQA
jgi:hypothetical protein